MTNPSGRKHESPYKPRHVNKKPRDPRKRRKNDGHDNDSDCEPTTKEEFKADLIKTTAEKQKVELNYKMLQQTLSDLQEEMALYLDRAVNAENKTRKIKRDLERSERELAGARFERDDEAKKAKELWRSQKRE